MGKNCNGQDIVRGVRGQETITYYAVEKAFQKPDGNSGIKDEEHVLWSHITVFLSHICYDGS